MHTLLTDISHHGYLFLFLIVFAEASGFPAPAALALIAAGAASAAHVLSLPSVLAAALVAMMLGDILLFVLGRYTGWALLAFLCRVSMNPETCILRSAETFYKRGKLTLIFAKFIPGVNTMAPPLAGSMKMKLAMFLQLDVIGASLYVLAYSALGYASRDFVSRINHGAQSAGQVFAGMIIAAIATYIAYRVVQYRRYRISDFVPRVTVEELAHRIADSKK
jgi:membrane protein DedA with SNARE-associated domain